MAKSFIQFCAVILLFYIKCVYAQGQDNVHYLEQGETFRYDPAPYRTRQLHIFCYQGKPKYIIHIWQSVLLLINHKSDDYSQFDGSTPEEVQKEYVDKRTSWSINLFSAKSKRINLNPFNNSCIGIESRDAYNVHLKVIKIDLWKLLSLVVGIMLFLAAERLSKNTVFHYICGISFGICASFLILIYLVSKIFPRKPLMWGVIGAGWTIVIYFLQILWDNLKLIMTVYKEYVIWYTIATGMISFILCYRWGPVTNKRTINLIKWSLQFLGLTSIFFSSHFQEAAMGQIVILILIRIMPKKWVSVSKTYWKRRFPPKVKLLSNDDYYEQGVRETEKALNELRQYCNSPECNQWNTALRLKDVKRFASFIEGNSHLSDEEVLEYETSMQSELTDDEGNEISEEEASLTE